MSNKAEVFGEPVHLELDTAVSSTNFFIYRPGEALPTSGTVQQPRHLYPSERLFLTDIFGGGNSPGTVSLFWGADNSGKRIARQLGAPAGWQFPFNGKQMHFAGPPGILPSASIPSSSAPSTASATASTTGGTLATASYSYYVTALVGTGETALSSNQVAAVTGPTGSVKLNWSPVTGAYAYNIYGRTAASEARIATVSSSSGVLSYTDTGADATTSQTAASVTNTTQSAAIVAEGYVEGQRNKYGTDAYSNLIKTEQGAFAYWPMGEAAASTTNLDKIGSNTLTAVGATVPSYRTPVMRGNTGPTGEGSVYYAGGTIRSTGTAPSQLFAANSPASFECWFMPSTAGVAMCIVQSGTGVTVAWGVEIDATNRVNVNLNNVLTSFGAPAAFSLLKWNHLVVTFNNALSICYLNGVNVANVAFGIGADPGSSTLKVGNNHAGARPFVGWLGSMSIYNQVLTAVQVLNHYNMGVGV